MAASPLNNVIQHLRKTVLLREGRALSDAQLLDRYIRQRESTALEIIVLRYGPMVWSICRRVLGNHHDAEDAFQATFLVLLRRAASIGSRDALGNWLYGVAHRTAIKSRQTASKRRLRETKTIDVREPVAPETTQNHDLAAILDDELVRLPTKYRAAVVLCDLEGKSRAEAACELRVPEGTVASRVARAREMLAKRLTRRGIGLSAAALAAALPQKAPACVPAATLAATLKVVALGGYGPASTLVSVQVAALTQGVIKAMFVSKLVRMSAVVVVLGLAALGSGIIQHQVSASAAGGDDQAVAQPLAPAAAQGGEFVAQKGKGKGSAQAGSKAEVEALQAEVEKLRTELNAALSVIQKMKEALGQTASPSKVQEQLYRGRPLRSWLEQYKDADAKFRLEAVEALAVLAEDNKALIPTLVACLRDKDDEVGYKASRTLGSFGPEMVPILVDVLKDKSSTQAMGHAANALGQLGPNAKSAVPVLTQALKVNGVRFAAIGALGRVGPEAKSAIPAIVEALGDSLNDKGSEVRSQKQPAKLTKGKGKATFTSIYVQETRASVNGVVTALSRIDPEFDEFASGMLDDIRSLTPKTAKVASEFEAEQLKAYRQFYEALKKRYEKHEP